MIATTTKLALLTFFAATAVLPLLPQDSCRLTVENTGTVGNPIYSFNCLGGCDSGDCQLGSTSGSGTTVWFCKCGTVESDVKCAGKVTLFQGVYTPACITNNCNQACNFLTFPVNPGGAAYVCTCPDIPEI